MPFSAVPIGGKDALNKRVPKSSKYENVKSVVKSGHSSKKIEERFDVRFQNIRFRRNENFRRIKAGDLEEVLRTGSLDILLLDIRDDEEYKQCHIQGAKSYPVRLLTRSVNPFTPEILESANREPEKIIIIYDLDERKTLSAGNLFFEKGIDNVFVLSQGMSKIQKEAPWLLEGDPEIIGPLSPGAQGSEASFRTAATSACSFQTDAPALQRKALADVPRSFNHGGGRVWK